MKHLITIILISIIVNGCSGYKSPKTIDTYNQSLYINKTKTISIRENIYKYNKGILRYNGYKRYSNNKTVYYKFRNGITYYNGYSQ